MICKRSKTSSKFLSRIIATQVSRDKPLISTENKESVTALREIAEGLVVLKGTYGPITEADQAPEADLLAELDL